MWAIIEQKIWSKGEIIEWRLHAWCKNLVKDRFWEQQQQQQQHHDQNKTTVLQFKTGRESLWT